jgi:hypothetical protein
LSGNYEIPEGQIKFTDESLRAAGAVVVDFILEQIASGLNADGNSLPPGVDLRQTGALLNSIRADVSSGQIEIVCDVPYAGVVQARYNFLGVAPSRISELERRLEPILARGAYYADAGR